jgi:aspartate aminotransferase-like enzyme
MIPGPTPVLPCIQDEMGRETVSFKDSMFIEDFKSVTNDLKELWGAEESFVIAGSGTLAMEMALANTLVENDNCLLISHGYFGDRFIEMLEKRSVNVTVMNSKWGLTIPVNDIAHKLRQNTYKAVIVTHVDTSTGVQADIKSIGKLVKQFEETLFIVDGVCSTAAIYENLKELHIDILLTASQKAFGVAPGLALLFASEKAMKRRQKMGVIRDSYMDFEKWLPIMHNPNKYWGTPPVNLIWALKKSLEIIKTETLEVRFIRHKKWAQAIRKALESVGFGILADEEHRAATLSNVLYYDGLDDVEFRKELAVEGVVVAGGLGEYAGKLFRLGHMGNIDMHTVTATLSAIERVVCKSNKNIKYGDIVGVFLQEVQK